MIRMFGRVSLVSKGDRRAPVRYRYVRDVDQPVAVIVVLVLDGHVAEDAMPLQRVEIHGEVLPNVERAIRLKTIAHIERANYPAVIVRTRSSRPGLHQHASGLAASWRHFRK